MRDPLDHFRNTITGPAYILGSGPSLRHLPSKLNGVVIAVNGSILKYPDANFYFSNDARVVFRSHWKTVIGLPNINVILSMYWTGFYDDWHIRPPYRAKQHGLSRDIPIADDRLFKFQQRTPYSNNVMTKNDTELLCSSSSAHAAVHFAYVMGADPIVLLGCDCCSEDGKNYYMDFPDQPQDEFSSLIEQWDNSEAHVVTHNSTWKDLADANPHVPIVNASGGKLDCFKRVKLEDINDE